MKRAIGGALSHRAAVHRAVARGAVVLCDRFADSTLVYQGAARDAGVGGLPGPSPEMAEALHALVIGIEPDATLIFDLEPEIALSRGVARGGEELRFERLGLAFHQSVRARFRALADILLPQILPSLVAAFGLTAAVAIGAYGTALALVGTQVNILPLLLYSRISETGSDFPAAAVP